MGKVEVEYKGDMLFWTKIGNHELEIDVPDEMGGKDRAMTPPELMLASLASCSAAFAVKYANTAGLNSEGLKAVLEYEKLENPLRLTNFKMVLKVPGVDDERKSKALLKAAGHCPVHQSFENFEGIDFSVEIGK